MNRRELYSMHLPKPKRWLTFDSFIPSWTEYFIRNDFDDPTFVSNNYHLAVPLWMLRTSKEDHKYVTESGPPCLCLWYVFSVLWPSFDVITIHKGDRSTEAGSPKWSLMKYSVRENTRLSSVSQLVCFDNESLLYCISTNLMNLFKNS